MDIKQRLKSLGIVIAIAAAYWLFARLGDLLDAPPVYASAIWPPAGIALGATLLLGRRALPGIWLGAVCANVRADALWPVLWIPLLLPAGIAIGACLQAAVAAYGIRRAVGAVGDGTALNDDASIVRFLFLAGPLGCCVNASFGSGLLLLAGKTVPGDFPVNWATWWIGDTIGAMMFTPLVLIAFAKPRLVWAPRWRTVAFPLLLSCMLVMALFSYVRGAEHRRRLDEFNNLADAAALALESSLQGYTDMLGSLKGFFDASEQVECGEFAVFANNLLEHKRGLQALEWAQWVRRGERQPFEQALARCGSGAEGITEKNAAGVLAAAEREAWLPVTYIEPLPPNRIAQGFDLLSEKTRREAVQKARDSQSSAATPPITLVQESAEQAGMLIVEPIYRKGGDTASVEGRRANFKGVVLGVFRVADMVDAALKNVGGRRALLRLQIRDESAPPGREVLYADAGFMVTGVLSHQRRIGVGGRVWDLSIAAEERDFGQIWATWFVLVSGLLFSGLLEGFLLLLTGRTSHMEFLVAERTDDLADSNRRLREEIAERARTEIALRESEARFRTLANAAPVLMWLSGTDKGCYWFNQVWLDFTGRSLRQEAGNGWAEGVHEDDLQRCLDCYLSHFERREPFRMEYRLRRYDGEYRWLVDTGVPLIDESGDFVGYIGSCIDVTESKNIEQTIRQLNRSYQDLLAAASEVSIIAVDPDGLITLFNRGAERMLGYAAEDMVGKHKPTLFHLPDEIAARECQLSEALGEAVSGFRVFTAKPDRDGQESSEWTYVCKDGLCIWVSLVVTQIKSEAGQTTGYLGIAQNITERKAAEIALRQAKLAADKANQAKSQFLANMSHEIRTPMNGVLGMLELLRGTGLDTDQRELADIAGQSAQALMAVIDDILDFSKIEAGKLKLDCADFDVRELCETVCLLMAVPAQAKGLEFNCFIHPHLNGAVRGDSTRLRQVLVNLLGNAVKFTFRGEVSFDVRCLLEDERRARLQFSVKDTGIGMRGEELSRLFMPFEQADQGTTRRFGGTGLGLSISSSLVRMMGGEIVVESASGVGSVFRFALDFEKSARSGLPQENLDLSGRSVLVADDNATNRGILECFLRHWGAVVQCAENGQQAVEILYSAHGRGKPFDLVILDQFMPKLDGVGVSRRISSDPRMKPLPCILLSASSSSSAALAPLLRSDLGIIAVLIKPVRQSQLFDAVADVFHASPPRQNSSPPSVDADLPQFPGRRVLLVEDNRVNQHVALKMLRRFGIVALLAEDGAQALYELQKARFDLVLMDCQIPEMDGYEVTRKLRQMEQALGLLRTPVLALTANAIAGDKEKSFAAGMDDHLTKPLALADLAVALPRWMPAYDGIRLLADTVSAVLAESAPAWNFQSTLDMLSGDLGLLDELKSLFISQAPKLVESLCKPDCSLPSALRAKAIAELAHELRGMAGNFFAKGLVDLCADIECKARDEAFDDLVPLLDALPQTLQRLLESLEG